METEVQSSELCQFFSTYLREKGGRFTQEREAIVQGIEHLEEHFTLDSVKQYLESRHFRVSLATLYNTLNELIGAGLVARFQVGEKTYYEVCFQKAYHCHQVCTHCGKIGEFRSIELDELLKKLKYKRFNYVDYTLMVYGVCSVCKAQLRRAGKNKNT